MAEPKLQGFAANHTKPCRPWREKTAPFQRKINGMGVVQGELKTLTQR
jgi:hypothetical protein